MTTVTTNRGQEAADFLGKRMRYRHREYPVRCTGRSSDALALYGVGQGPRPFTVGHPEADSGGGCWLGSECDSNAPMDEGDLLACTVSYLMAPKWAQERMLPVLEEFQNWVWHGINRHGAKLRAGYRDV